MFGGKVTLDTIDDGSLSITVAGVDVVLTELDFAAATSYSDIASILQTALRNTQTDPALTGLTVEYSSQNKNYIITTGTTGEDATITYATDTTGTNLSNVLLLSSTAALFQSNGRDATPIATMMTELKTVSLNWVSFMTVEEQDETNALAYASWVNSQNSGCRFVYVCQDSDTNAKVSGNETNLSYLIKELGYSGTTLQYSTANISAFVMGVLASIKL